MKNKYSNFVVPEGASEGGAEKKVAEDPSAPAAAARGEAAGWRLFALAPRNVFFCSSCIKFTCLHGLDSILQRCISLNANTESALNNVPGASGRVNTREVLNVVRVNTGLKERLHTFGWETPVKEDTRERPRMPPREEKLRKGLAELTK